AIRMTSLLRRKRRTTARGRNTLTWTAASLLGIGLFIAGGAAYAQQSSSSLAPYGKLRQSGSEFAPLPPVPTPSSLPNVTTPATPSDSSTGNTLTFHKDAGAPAEPIKRTSAQITPRPAETPARQSSSYGADDLQTPIPLGLREGGPNPVVRLESEENFD